jgi:hypothetical protein
MSKSPEKHGHNPIAGELIQEEALRVARGIQKPGQTKEQTKLIAQGIAKGIALYKKQQSAKDRERDKAHKRAMRLRQAELRGDEEQPDEADWSADNADGRNSAAFLTGGALFAAMAAMHLVRVFAGWNLILGAWAIPSWASLAAAVLSAGLSSWFFYRAAVSR